MENHIHCIPWSCCGIDRHKVQVLDRVRLEVIVGCWTLIISILSINHENHDIVSSYADSGLGRLEGFKYLNQCLCPRRSCLAGGI